MMKLYTDPGNFDSLKISLAASENSFPIEIEFNKETSNVPLPWNKSPIFVHGSTKLVFTNVICLYLYEKRLGVQLSFEIQEWLEWENKEFGPLLIHGVSSKSLILSALKSRISTVLHVTENVSILDIILWCDLYPLMSDQGFATTLFHEIPELRSWYDTKTRIYSKYLESTRCSTLKTTNGGASSSSKFPKIEPSSSTKLNSDPSSSIKLNSETDIHEAIKQWFTEPISSPSPRKAPILPITGERNVLVTSALPYVNNVPHLGNITGAVLSADVFARFSRLRLYNTLFICGTDEHGTTTETKALAEGVTPQQICDKYHTLHSEIYDWFDISFDHFGRTTTSENKRLTQDIFTKLYENGQILEDSMDQLWCESCSRFLADRFVEGTCPLCKSDGARGDQCDACGKLINAVDLSNPQCTSCKSSPIVKTTKHLFLDLPKIESQLSNWLDRVTDKWSNNAKVIAKSWIKLGLQPRCITRDLKWGIQVPLKGYEDKVFYVWFDAPIGYVGITACYTDKWSLWWKNPDNVEYFEFMGKDNVPFHSVIFPSILLGTGEKWTMVNRIMATEYLNYEDAKFSKSRGTGVFGNDAKDTGIDSDVWRFYLIYTRPENQDSAFKWNDLLLKNNSELLGNLGNFVNRSLKFLKDNFGGKLCPISESDFQQDLELGNFLVEINKCLNMYVDLQERAHQREAVMQILNVSRLGNQLMQSYKPWKLIKDGDKTKAALIVSICVNVVTLICVMISPIMPKLSDRIRSQLNAENVDLHLKDPKFRRLLPTGHVIGTPAPLISEIKPEDIKKFEERFSGKSNLAQMSSSKGEDVETLRQKVTTQGDIVRTLKAEKASKDKIDSEVKILLDLKSKLATLTGEDDGKKSAKKKKSNK